MGALADEFLRPDPLVDSANITLGLAELSRALLPLVHISALSALAEVTVAEDGAERLLDGVAVGGEVALSAGMVSKDAGPWGNLHQVALGVLVVLVGVGAMHDLALIAVERGNFLLQKLENAAKQIENALLHINVDFKQ